MTMTDPTIDSITNPDQANAMIAGALADNSAPAVVEMPKVAPPPDRSVKLLAGITNQLDGSTETDAVVRELTGVDEEALTSPAFVRSVAKYMAAMAERGTETIGGRKPTKDELGALLVGDRELLLLGIRKATYGHELELTTICPFCEDRDEEFVYDLDDIPIIPLENPLEAVYGYQVELPSGRTAHVGMSTAADQDAILEASGKNEGELNTLMLSRCVQKIDGNLIVDDNQLRALGLRDRKAIIQAITDHTPGPRLGEAKRTCRACEKEFELGLGLLDIFRA